MAVDRFGAAADHAALTGLGAGDPHPQYSTVLTGLAAARPAVGADGLRAGTFYIATDTGSTTVYSGTAWLPPGLTAAQADAAYARLTADNIYAGGQSFRDAVELAPRPENAFGLQYEPAGTNLVTNPSFEVDTTGWHLTGAVGGATPAGFSLARTTAWAAIGTASIEMTIPAGTAQGEMHSPRVAVTPGEVLSASAVLRTTRAGGVAGVQLRMGVTWETSANAHISNSALTSINLANGVSGRFTVEGVAAPANAAFAKFSIVKNNDEQGAYTMQADGVQLERNPVATSYIDGAQGTGFAWTGTAHASTSTRAAGIVARAVTDVATTNLLTNPNFEGGTGWEANTVSPPPVFSYRSGDARIGSRYGRLDLPGGSAFQALTAVGGPASPGTYSAGVWVRGTPGKRIVIYVSATVNGSFSGDDGSGTVHTLTSEWTRITTTRTLPAGTTTASTIITNHTGGDQGAYFFEVDGAQLESGQPTSYADGSLGTGYAWTGTAHASTSTRAAGTAIAPAVQAPPPYGLVSDAPGRNLCRNPSFEVDTAGWVVSNGTGTLTRSTDAAYVGGACGALAVPAGANFQQVRTDRVPAAPGEVFSARGWMRAVSGKTLRFLVVFHDTNGSELAAGIVVQDFTSDGTWQSRTATTTAPANTATVEIRFGKNGVDQGAFTIFADAFQLERTSTPTSYMDGSLGPGYEWEGTPHASPSRRLAGTRVVGTRSVLTAAELDVPMYGCRLFKNDAATIASGTFTNYGWSGKHYDPYGMLASLGDSVVTIKKSGHYLLNASWRRNGTGSGTNYDCIRIARNGSGAVLLAEWQVIESQGFAQQTSLSGTYYLAAGDQILVQVYQSTGASTTIETGPDRNFFDVILLGV